MAAYVVCECCGSKIPAAQEDVGKAVVCPVSRRLVMVYPGDLHVIPDPPKRKRRKWPLALLALLLFAGLLGGGGYLVWDWLGKEKKDDTAQNNPEPDKKTPQPVPEKKKDPEPEKKTPPDVDITAVVPAFPSVKKADPGTVAVKPEEPEKKKEPDPPPAKVEPPLIKTAAEKDVNGLPVYELANRLDLRKPDELERELLNVREIQLDTPAAPDTSKKLFDDGSKLRAEKKPYPGPVLAAKGRDDLAGLPFKVGNAADLGPTRAGDVEKHSAPLRKVVQDSSPGGTVEPNKLYAALLDGKAAPGNDPAWTTDAAVPGVQKLLQHESKYVRRLAVEALRKNPSPAATELLCRWAVFDVDPENRAAAVNALGERKNDRAAIKTHLLDLIRYPWPRAAEHAAEALVALRMVEAVPNLVVLLDLPDPDAPEKAADGTSYRREMVRTNTARNCLLCHTPSPGAEPLRGVDYKNQAASATSTYLRHDFSAGLPVTAGGKAGPQRYDFVAGVFPVATPGPSPDPSPYREAVLWALRHLTGENLGTTAAAWAKYRGTAVAPDYRLTYWTDRYRTWYAADPTGYAYWAGDWGDRFLDLDYDEQAVVLAHMAQRYGPQPTYDALIAYLESYRLTGTPEEQKKAVELLEYYRKVGVAGFVDETRVRRVYANPKARAVYRGYATGYVGTRGGVWDKNAHAPLYAGLSDPDRAVRLRNIRYFGNFK
ncbi:MAG: HEAT repeat domain-containing protein, partial [Gemmataceae bacterium]|nr:HEAT repeat domain-containing protein [Gemmataceae bacterium]